MDKDTLICPECSKPMVTKQCNLEFKHPKVGIYVVPSVLHIMCETCNIKIIGPTEARRIELIETRKYLMYFLNKNGKQPLKTLLKSVNSDESLLRELLESLQDQKVLSITTENGLEVVVPLLLQPKDKFLTKVKTKLKKLINN